VVMGRRLVLMALAVTIVAVAGAAGGIYHFWREHAVAAQPVAKAEESTAVGALGRIEPASEIIKLGSGVTDRLDSLMVKRGDLVKKDQILGYLQSHAEQVAQRDEIAAQLEEAKLRLATETELDLARVDDATIKLKIIAEVAPLRIEAQVKTIESLEAGIANDKDILHSLDLLVRKNFTPRRTHDNQQTLVAQEQANLKSAEALLAQMRRESALDLEEAEAQIRLAKAALERSKADVPIASLTKQLGLAAERVRRTTIYAPIDGRILNVIAHPGELVGGDKTILAMGDTSRMRAVAEVYETDIARVRLGQVATITSRALDRAVTGTVIEIGRMIFKNDVLNVDPAARADARVVEVRIELDDVERTAELTNLTVDVLINGSDRPIVAAEPLTK
jgi:HlyD family secretion protein